MMKRFVFFAFGLALATSVFAEDPTHVAQNELHYENGETNGVGAGGTVFWTWGFMYRRHFANGFGFSTSLGGWFSQEQGHIGNELGLLYSFAHYKFSSTALPESSIRVYAVGYLANIYNRATYHNFDRWAKVHALDIGLGAGPGLEYFFNRHFAIHAELPWMTFVKVTNKGVSFRDSYPHFGGGFIYYF